MVALPMTQSLTVSATGVHHSAVFRLLPRALHRACIHLGAAPLVTMFCFSIDGEQDGCRLCALRCALCLLRRPEQLAWPFAVVSALASDVQVKLVYSR